MTNPAQLGQYPITSVIGQGSMGVVYRAFDPQIERSVAIKTIKRELLDGSDHGASIAARFKIEAQAAGRLNHPGIVSVYHFGEDDDCAYIVMEYVEGHSLREYVSKGIRFSEPDILSIMSQLLDALEFAHERGVFHRDIKPANLIVTRDGKVKVTDFGIARIESTQLTRVNSVIGSPGYMAPEQYTGDLIDRRVDVFAAGVLLYQLLTGGLPFTGTDDAVMYKIIYGEPTLPSQTEGASQWAHYDAVVAMALAKSRENRYASARDFKQALVAAANRPIPDALSETARLQSPPRGSEAAAGIPASTPGAQRPFSVPSPSSRTPAPPTGWDERMLATLERDLAHYVGPMAKLLVRRAARGVGNIHDLRTVVARSIASAADQRKFLGQESATRTGPLTRFGTMTNANGTPTTFGGVPTARLTGAGPATAMAQVTSLPITAASLEYSTKVLIRHVGPIARLMVKKVATNAQTREELFERLAAEFKVEAEREKVLDELRRFR